MYIAIIMVEMTSMDLPTAKKEKTHIEYMSQSRSLYGMRDTQHVGDVDVRNGSAKSFY